MILSPFRWRIEASALPDRPGIFPLLPGQTFLGSKGPQWSTDVRRATSGRTVRTQWWSYPIWKFEVGYEFIRSSPPAQADLQKLFAFFCTAAGQAGEFCYFDPSDHLVGQQQFGTGDGTTVDFQLVRHVGGDGSPVFDFVEPIFALAEPPTILVDDAVVTSYVVSELGVVTFGSPPADGAVLTWSGKFMFRCSFSQDYISPSQMVRDLWSSSFIPFESIKP